MKKILTSKVGKRGKLLIYADGKKATERERKEFLNKNYQLINKDTVSTEEWKYVNRVKGGKERAKNSLTYKGQFLSKTEQKKLIKEAKKKGIDLEMIKQGNKAEGYSELFKNRPELKKSLDKIFTETGLPYWYSIWTWTAELDETERVIFVHGEEVAKLQAKKLIDDVISILTQKYEPAGGIIKFTHIGIDKLFILDTLTAEAAEEMNEDDPRDLDEYANELILFISKPKNEKGKKSKKSPRRK
jgi:hypothetical protein